MNVTASSTGELDNVLRRVVPSPWKQQLDDILAELEHRRAQGADKAAAMRAQRTADLRTVTDTAVELHRLQLTAWTGSATSRAKWLQRQIAVKGITPVPGWRYVFNYLKRLQL
jgi:hypothetical protein